MGYSKSKNAVERARVLLEKIAQLVEGASLEIPSTTPTELSYALREAFHSAAHHKKTYPNYADFKERYRIKQNFNSVSIEPRTKKQLEFSDPITHLGRSSVITVEEAVTFLEIVGAAIKHKAPKLIFPNAEVGDTDITRIKKWCSINNYQISKYNPLTLERCHVSTLPTTQDMTILPLNGTEN